MRCFVFKRNPYIRPDVFLAARSDFAIMAFMALFMVSCSSRIKQEADSGDSSFLTLERLFNSNEFAAESIGAPKWADGGAAYLKLEPASDGSKGRELARYNTESGAREVIVSASLSDPGGNAGPAPCFKL